jgi:outer membrane protein
MKQFSMVLNLVLLAAVGVLYYLHFSKDTKLNVPQKQVSPTVNTTNTVRPAIAYVELDSLNEKISYIRLGRKELEAEQQSIETEWENSYRNLENQKNNFLKRGNAITQEEAEKFQASLLQQQQQVDGRKQNLSQKLNEKSYKFMEEIQKKLKDFLTAYNEDKNFNYIFTTGNGLEYMVYKDSSLNITADVIKGMNDVMKSTSKN